MIDLLFESFGERAVKDLSLSSISVDILIACIFLLAGYRALIVLLRGKHIARYEIYMVIIIILAGIFAFQTFIQVLTHKTSYVMVWDVFNWILVFLCYTLATRLYRNNLGKE